MAIRYDEEKRIFSLHTIGSTYRMQADPHGLLLHLYYDRQSTHDTVPPLPYADRGFSGNPYDLGTDRTYSADLLPQEYPHQGSGDTRSTALIVRDEGGAFGCDLRYRSHEIRSGKYALRGLPAVHAPSDEAETLIITLYDERLKLAVDLYYGVLPALDIITRAAIVRNEGVSTITLEKASTACLDFLSGDYDLTVFPGRHAMERVPERFPVTCAEHRITGRMNMSSHSWNPLLLLSDRDTTEDTGRCYAAQFVWSGGFLAETARDRYDQTRLLMGLMEEQFSFPLSPGESVTLPEVILTWSENGFSQLSHNLHRVIRDHVCQGPFAEAPRPVVWNSWEAHYFNCTGDRFLDLAKEAASLGADLVVMDDGWFGKRNDDLSSLGDWTVNEEKLGMPLSELVGKVHGMGLKFGLWVEPEMVSEDSELYREHPDYALAIPGKAPVRARHQLVLDFSRREVRNAVYRQISALIKECGIDYIKWDCNRGITDVYSHQTAGQGRVLYDYILGVYAFLSRLRTDFPKLLIEGCAGGGGRFDAGMLFYTPQIWCSDNTDAIDRLSIQYGTSFGYPLSTIAAHVSASPNEQNGRVTPLRTRGLVAMTGIFGYELDPSSLTEEDKKEIRTQILFFRTHEQLLRNGRFFRLTDPRTSPCAAFEVLSADRREALVLFVVTEHHANMPPVFVRLKGLLPDTDYHEQTEDAFFDSTMLTHNGFLIPPELKQYEARLLHFRAV